MSERIKDRLLGVVVLVGVLGALAGVGLLAWMIANASPGDARMWAFLASLGLPVVALGAYWLGKLEARGQVAGLDQGIERVSRAASDTAALRVNVHHAMRAPVQPPAPTIIELPQVPAFRDPPRLQSGDVVEL